MLLGPPRQVGEAGIVRPFRPADDSAQRDPLLVRRNGDRDPAVVAAVLVGPGHLVEILRRRAGSAVAGSAEEGAVRRELDHLLRRHVERSIDHGGLDQATFACLLAVLEGKQQAPERVQPGVGVTDAIRLEGKHVRVSGQPGEPRRVLDDERERGQVPPWAVESEARHAQHDQIGSLAPQRLEVEAQLVQHSRRVVLDHDVTRRDEAAHQIDATLVTQVDRHALLVRVECGKDRTSLPVPILRLGHAAHQSGSIGVGR